MTLTLVTRSTTGPRPLASVFTELNGHCHTCHSSILPVPSLPFGRGLGAQPPMPVSPRLRQPSLPSHAPTLPPGPSSALGSHRRVVKTRLMGRSPAYVGKGSLDRPKSHRTHR